MAFGYFVVLPAAVRFFQNFNSGQFNVLVQASQYYHFVAVILLAMGLVFQVPVGILAATASGIVTPSSAAPQSPLCAAGLRRRGRLPARRRRHALLETVPLYLLFELSVALASIAQRRERRRAGAG